jgi:outer membrane protein OmpA-like peptidoglycan-associated protein
VVEYLKQKGIDPRRLTWVGYGESQPLIYPELSDEDEQANRRAEFRILSIDLARAEK